MIRHAIAWAIFDGRCVAYIALLHWAAGKPIPGFYRGRNYSRG